MFCDVSVDFEILVTTHQSVEAVTIPRLSNHDKASNLLPTQPGLLMV